jgi:Dolichyl-phosphate-mannose-protein mannosyltransferase
MPKRTARPTSHEHSYVALTKTPDAGAMSSDSLSYPASAPASIRARRRVVVRGIRWFAAPELIGLAALAGVLNLWGLSINGWANTYYSAAVRSMSTSWHNFLYAAMDPSGLMTVDKPPLSLWVQALSVRIFGYHPLSLLVPQALMGVVAVVFVYDLVRRRSRQSRSPSRGTTIPTSCSSSAASPRCGSSCARWTRGVRAGWSSPASPSASGSRPRWVSR